MACYHNKHLSADTVRGNEFVRFSGQLLQHIAEYENSEDNVVISPSCLYQTLAMMSQLTASATKSQIVKALGGQLQMHKNVNHISKIETPECGASDFDYSIACSLWADDGLPLNPILSPKNGILPITLHQVTMGSAAANHAIAAWISDHTGGMFANDPHTSPTDVLLVFGAMHLKDAWMRSFDKGDRLAFTLNDGTTKTITFMEDWGDYNLFERDGSITFAKPLTSGTQMIISVPDAQMSLNEYIAEDAWNNIVSFISGKYTEQYRECRVFMPKFDASTVRLDIKEIVTSLGITDIFNADANFSPLTSHQLTVDTMYQSTCLMIDEEGLEGASYIETILATGVPLFDRPDPKIIYVDRPFVVTVISPNGMPLFVGLITNPKDE